MDVRYNAWSTDEDACAKRMWEAGEPVLDICDALTARQRSANAIEARANKLGWLRPKGFTPDVHLVWNEERTELLKQLWAQGLSASQIVNRLGGVTRSGVLGKVHRLGLSGRVTTVRKAVRPKVVSGWMQAAGERKKSGPKPQSNVPPLAAVKQTDNPFGAKRKQLPPSENDFRTLVEKAASDVARVSFDELTTGKHCKWPVGEVGKPGFGFCGEEPVPNGPYCCEHAQRATTVHVRRRVPTLPDASLRIPTFSQREDA